MTADEHAMIDEPLARILARLAPETTELIDRWTDPLLLATGLVMWGARVFFELSRQAREEVKKERKAKSVEREAKQESGDNGKTGLDITRPMQATGIPQEVAEALG
jgi:hypothetical protein